MWVGSYGVASLVEGRQCNMKSETSVPAEKVDGLLDASTAVLMGTVSVDEEAGDSHAS
jgi:hypothetical protein